MASATEHLFSALTVLWVIAAYTWADRTNFKEDEIKISEFDVKPGGVEHSHKMTWDDYTCEFTYRAQGGTNEQWSMGLSRGSDNSEWLCHIERPGGVSYLFFQEFKLQINGAQLQEVFTEGRPDQPLKNKEYVIQREENLVKQSDNFESQLSRIEIYATRGKTEL